MNDGLFGERGGHAEREPELGAGAVAPGEESATCPAPLDRKSVV